MSDKPNYIWNSNAEYEFGISIGLITLCSVFVNSKATFLGFETYNECCQTANFLDITRLSFETVMKI